MLHSPLWTSLKSQKISAILTWSIIQQFRIRDVLPLECLCAWKGVSLSGFNSVNLHWVQREGQILSIVLYLLVPSGGWICLVNEEIISGDHRTSHQKLYPNIRLAWFSHGLCYCPYWGVFHNPVENKNRLSGVWLKAYSQHHHGLGLAQKSKF